MNGTITLTVVNSFNMLGTINVLTYYGFIKCAIECGFHCYAGCIGQDVHSLARHVALGCSNKVYRKLCFAMLPNFKFIHCTKLHCKYYDNRHRKNINLKITHSYSIMSVCIFVAILESILQFYKCFCQGGYSS
jgi:hypothetical protein